MNMVNMSIEMKKPYTPMLRSVNQRKYSFFIGSICQEANVPVNTMIEVRRIITTEIPSTPSE